MDPERRKRIEAIFHGALELPISERDGYIEVQCGGDDALRDAVGSLVAHHDEAEGLFAPDDRSPEHPPTPDRIGPFQIIRTLGEGGMGTVYLARQEEPIARQVALKVIKPGMDSKQVLSRFHAERQALALLDHPSIARVFDAGSTEDGLPYFAMEYVSGTPITRFCDDKRMGFRERIAVFLKVCQAIQHAHQKGIIHRDIKPGNVIVTEHDGEPLPKVIDFGIAKATAGGMLPAVTFTREGQLVGTLEYMSPEQAAALDVDTRTDVYALGILLYELLVGVLPFDAASLRDRGLDAMIRVIRDSDPPRPSTRVSTLGETAIDAARRRGTEPRSLARSLRGDLDWIVMKALERDRERRYGSAAGFAADLSRYLDSQPVEARPPSAVYRFRKFTRRHRVGVSVATLACVALVTIAAVTAWQSARVKRERDHAENQDRISREVADYLGSMFHQAAMAYGFADSVRLMDAMSMGVENLGRADVTPEARIRILRVLGDAYSSMSRLDEALPVIQSLVDQSVVHYGEDHLETAEGRLLLLGVQRQLGNWDAALRLANLVLPVFERELGPEHPQTLRCVWYLAQVNSGLGHDEAALALYKRLETAYRRTLGNDHPRLGMLYNEMSFPLGTLGRYKDAELAARRSVEILESRYGDDSPMVLLPLDALTSTLIEVERFDEASRVLDKIERIAGDTYGPSHPRTKQMRADRAWILLGAARYDSARVAFEDALVVPANVPERHLAARFVGLGIADRELGDIGASRHAIRRGLSILNAAFGESHARVAAALTALGETELAAGNLEPADSLLRRASAMAAALLPPGHLTVATAKLALGECLLAQRRFAEAEPLLLGARDVLTHVCPANSRRVARARRSLDALYEAWPGSDRAREHH